MSRKRLLFTSAVEFSSRRQFPEGAVFAIIGPFESHMADPGLQDALTAALRKHHVDERRRAYHDWSN